LQMVTSLLLALCEGNFFFTNNIFFVHEWVCRECKCHCCCCWTFLSYHKTLT
jgi:hypothetical protein